MDGGAETVAAILDPVSAAITTEVLTELGVRIAVDQESIDDVAGEFLALVEATKQRLKREGRLLDKGIALARWKEERSFLPAAFISRRASCSPSHEARSTWPLRANCRR